MYILYDTLWVIKPDQAQARLRAQPNLRCPLSNHESDHCQTAIVKFPRYNRLWPPHARRFEMTQQSTRPSPIPFPPIAFSLFFPSSLLLSNSIA